MSNKLRLITKIEPDGAVQEVIGRDAWALKNLIAAGKRGCTPITYPGPRWSAYVFNLRKMGFIVETIHDNHEGPFAGTHARYVLHSVVTIRQEMGRAA